MKECRITIGDQSLRFFSSGEGPILPHLADAIKMVYESMNVYARPQHVKVTVGEVSIEVWP